MDVTKTHTPGPDRKRKRVIVVGAGFGGLNAAKELARQKDLDILVLDRRNHHLFQPLLYQVAMAGLSPADISFPIRSVFRRHDHVQVLLAEVRAILIAKNRVVSDIGEFEYDYLILACGAEHSYFGHQEWEEFAPGLKTVEQATEIRRRVLVAFEKAEAQNDAEKLRQWLTFIIIGGGPTGVELAGALGEITRYTLAEDFRHIDPVSTRVILIEAGPRILAAFHEDLARRAMRDLEKLGVQVWTNCRVSQVTNEGVQIGGEWVQARTVIWAAGVKPSPLNAQLGAPLDRAGRVTVTRGLFLPDHPNVFVIGDEAYAPGEDGRPLPGLAPVAMQQGRFVARQIGRDLSGKPREDFRYRDKGQMATIGRRSAVVEFGRLRFGGLIAWYLWLFVHVYYLIGFRNRILVLWQWFYSYVTYRRGARLITHPDWRSKPPPQPSQEDQRIPEPRALETPLKS
ncbi:MAG: NAD(P)/FAD-dependent oxidoreductase [Bdellovibrionales bacterium]